MSIYFLMASMVFSVVILVKKDNVSPWVAIAYIILVVVTTLSFTLDFFKLLGGK